MLSRKKAKAAERAAAFAQSSLTNNHNDDAYIPGELHNADDHSNHQRRKSFRC